MSDLKPVPWKSAISVPTKTQLEQVAHCSSLELIIRCQRHRRPDQVAFSEIVHRYQTHVDRTLYQLASDWSDRADLAQEVWIRVYRNIHRLQEPIKFKSWLGRIITNLFYDELRKRKRHGQPISLDAPISTLGGHLVWELACGSPSPIDTIMTDEFYDKLRGAIAELPEVFRTAIALRELQGLSYDEIAFITGVSLGTVKSRIARARHHLQRPLKRYLDEAYSPSTIAGA
ncbi:MAG: sigma-70 family RNA polymerase sigma factor [Cyanobacteria bacterium P01_D01_bin.44]